jgi:hypothetical protein
LKLPRITNCLLTALLALVASFAVPVARHEATRSAQQIVWVGEARAPRRETVERPDLPIPTRVGQQAVVRLSYRAPRRRLILAPSLFQRPPPAAFLPAQS